MVRPVLCWILTRLCSCMLEMWHTTDVCVCIYIHTYIPGKSTAAPLCTHIHTHPFTPIHTHTHRVRARAIQLACLIRFRERTGKKPCRTAMVGKWGCDEDDQIFWDTIPGSQRDVTTMVCMHACMYVCIDMRMYVYRSIFWDTIPGSQRDVTTMVCMYTCAYVVSFCGCIMYVYV